MRRGVHDSRDVRAAQESSSRQKDDTMSNEKPTEEEHFETLDQSDESSPIQTTSAGAAPATRRRRKQSKKPSVSSFYSSPTVPKVEPRKGSLFSDVWEDVCRLPRALYPLIRWPLFFYVLWVILSNSMLFFYHKAVQQLEPVCGLPMVGHLIPLCSGSSEAPPSMTIDVTKVATSQGELDLVINSVGQNFGLARDMVGHEFAVRDLRIRVAASDLSRKGEIASELDSLVRETKKTAKDLSRFTAKVGKSIDACLTFDEYAVKTLEGIASREQQVPTLQQKAISFLNPLSAFQLPSAAQIETELKHIFLSTSTRIADKVKLLIDDCFDLDHGLDKIQETLDRLKELAVDEVGDLPKMDVLRALWIRLAHADDYIQYKSHETLLTDVTDFYKRSSEVMQETFIALNRMEAELLEFRDDFATPGLVLKEQPLELTIELLRKAVHRLESGKIRFDSMEAGKGAQRHGLPAG